jgi:predicted nucleic acid-binding protein
MQDNDIVNIETQSKLYIQSLVKYKVLTLVTSFVLADEIGKITTSYKKNNISEYINNYGTVFVEPKNRDYIESLADEIIKTGVKTYDALHVACAIYAGCSYFITTDKRLLKYKTEKIKLLNPVDFVKLWEGQDELR